MKKKNLLMTAIAIFGLAAVTFGQTVPSYVPTTGLVGWWPFTGNAIDSSGNGNNGTVNGATLTTDRNGSANSAYNFSGADYIGISSSTIPSTVINNAQLFTLSFWVYDTANNPTVSYFGSWNESNGGFYINDYLGSSSAFAVLPNGQIFNTATNMTGSWHNLIYEFDGNQTGNSNRLKLFFDGVLKTLNYPYSVPSSLGGGASSLLFGARQVFGNPGEFLTGKLDDIGIWNRVLDSCEIKDLYYGSLGNCCNISVTTQPINQSVNISNNAQFVVNSSDPSATYQWQTDLGVGYQNLNNVGQYSGATNDTLTVSNVTMSNNNQPFRCIITLGACTDTSAVAVLTVNNNVGINETSQENLFSVFPNPAQSVINVNADSKLIGDVYSIYDNTGRVVLTGKLNSQNTTIELGNLSGGIYMLSVGENLKQTFKVIKE